MKRHDNTRKHLEKLEEQGAKEQTIENECSIIIEDKSSNLVIPQTEAEGNNQERLSKETDSDLDVHSRADHQTSEREIDIEEFLGDYETDIVEATNYNEHISKHVEDVFMNSEVLPMCSKEKEMDESYHMYQGKS